MSGASMVQGAAVAAAVAAVCAAFACYRLQCFQRWLRPCIQGRQQRLYGAHNTGSAPAASAHETVSPADTPSALHAAGPGSAVRRTTTNTQSFPGIAISTVGSLPHASDLKPGNVRFGSSLSGAAAVHADAKPESAVQ